MYWLVKEVVIKEKKSLVQKELRSVQNFKKIGVLVFENSCPPLTDSKTPKNKCIRG